MHDKLPENIDQLESFYQEQFDNFSVEVSDSMWYNINDNIPHDQPINVPSAHLAKVGIIMASVLSVLVAANMLLTDESKEVEVLPTIIETVKENTPVIEEPIIIEKETITPSPITKETPETITPEERTPIEEVDTPSTQQESTGLNFVEEFVPEE